MILDMAKDILPTISIVTCTYNSDKYLEKALLSVQNQKYENIEHIINDSYSTDNTLAIIQNYIESNKERYSIKLTHCEPRGVANALNVATENATGDIIHYLHSDDYYFADDALQKVAQYFIHDPELMWLTGNYLVEVKGRIISIPQTYLLRINPEKALSGMNIISHENTFMKRETVKKYGGFSEGKNEVVEYRLWLNLIRDHKPLILDDQFTVFIIHSGSTSTGNLLKFSKAVLRAFRTQKKEGIFPLIGYYRDKGFYKKYQKIINRIQEFQGLFDF